MKRIVNEFFSLQYALVFKLSINTTTLKIMCSPSILLASGLYCEFLQLHHGSLVRWMGEQEPLML